MRTAAPDFDVPTYCGREKYRELFNRYGPPNVAPVAGGPIFSRDARVLFLDDDLDGKPVAYWVRDCKDVSGLGAAARADYVTVYHSTDARGARRIVREQALRPDAEPDVYVSSVPQTAYGPVVVEMQVPRDELQLDDEFPDGRQDFRIRVGRPGDAFYVRNARVV